MTRSRNPLFPVIARALVALFALTAVVVAAPQDAQAHRTVTLYEYEGGHPIPEPVEGWCDEFDLHVHSYALDPDHYAIYEVDGVIHFMGDPSFYGYRGDMHWYYDPHPVGHINHHWCVLEGPHGHIWEPLWSHRHYGRRYWSVYDTYYVYTGLYDGWFSWTWDLYYARVWGVHVRVVNRYRNVYSHRHPIYGYVDHHDRRPSWSGRHRHSSNHDSARPRSSWGDDRERSNQSSQSRPRSDRSEPANGRATWEGGSSAGSAGERGVSEDRRSYADRDEARNRSGASIAPDRSSASGERTRSSYDREPDRSRRSYGDRTDDSRPSYDRSTTYDRSGSSRTYGGSSSSKSSGSRYDTPSRSSSSRTYGDSSSSKSSGSSYDTPSRSSSSRTYGDSSSSKSSGSRYDTPSRSSSSRTYGGSSSSKSSSSRYGTPSRSSSSRTYGGSSSSRSSGSSSSSKSSGSSSSSSSSSSDSSKSSSSRPKSSSSSKSKSSKSKSSKSSSRSKSSRRR